MTVTVPLINAHHIDQWGFLHNGPWLETEQSLLGIKTSVKALLGIKTGILHLKVLMICLK